MKKAAFLILFLVICLLTACGRGDVPTVPATEPLQTIPETVPVTTCTVPLPPVAEPEATAQVTEPETTVPPAEPVISLTEKEKTILLKLGMAERGDTDCAECIALVMRTVLNRAEAGYSGKDIRSVVFAQNQFTPVMNGSYYAAVPNERCYEALEMVVSGWDESQGALFYEWCEGESWHSRNLQLLFQHCDTRFYH